MTLLSESIPESDRERARWLENALLRPDLSQLIGELDAMARHQLKVAPRFSLDEILGQSRDRVLAEGLGGLGRASVQGLLQQPELLEELLFLVMSSGGVYWDRLLDTGEVHASVNRVTERVAAEVAHSTKVVNRPPTSSRWRSLQHAAIVSMATAAAVLIVIYLMPDSHWGWAKSGVVNRGDDKRTHLLALADAAAEWRLQPRADAAALRKALVGMRDGCTQVIAAAHPQLQPDDREWLMEKCLAWGHRLDEHLAALQTGKDFEEVRRNADATVEKLIEVLTQRARL